MISSPRVWGQVVSLLEVLRFIRIIPTRVGTSIPHDDVTLYMPNHPHACGDKSKSFYDRNFYIGSSPRVWGQDIFPHMLLLNPRIIPTRVGTSVYSVNEQGGSKDHPHACGDKIVPPLMRCSGMGSSPRVWGQATLLHSPASNVRIIPTRVGTSRLRSSYKRN